MDNIWGSKIPESLRNIVDPGLNIMIDDYYSNKIERIKKINPKSVISRSNPIYNILTEREKRLRAERLLSEYMITSDKTALGNYLESLALKICNYCFNGIKSSADKIDVEYQKPVKEDIIDIILSIKSNMHSLNSSSKRTQIKAFREAVKRKKSNNTNNTKIECIIGCCFGETPKNQTNKEYKIVCGKDFWYLISDNQYIHDYIIWKTNQLVEERESTEEYNIIFAKKVQEIEDILL